MIVTDDRIDGSPSVMVDLLLAPFNELDEKADLAPYLKRVRAMVDTGANSCVIDSSLVAGLPKLYESLRGNPVR